MESTDQHKLFEQVVLPHLDAAYNLARWLTRNDQDAEDAVQEACLRAFRFLDGFRGPDGRGWLLAIVRRTCYTRLRQNRAHDLVCPWDDSLEGIGDDSLNPETLFMRKVDVATLRLALEDLPCEFREAVVLRDVEGLSYQEIAGITEVPLGTVMSRLARGRKRLQKCLTGRLDREFPVEL